MQYKYLSDTAKEQAFKRHVEYAQSNDYYWWESVMEYWVEKLEGLGIYTDTNKMHFSGFGSQGDGACFTGYIDLKQFLEAHPEIKNNHVDLYLSTVPFDTDSEDYCEYYDVALTRLSNNYCHENTVHLGNWNLTCDINRRDYFEGLMANAEPDIEEQCREYMRQLYKDLEAEHDYQQSMENFLTLAPYQDFNELGELI